MEARLRVRSARPTDDASVQRILAASWSPDVAPGPPIRADERFFQSTSPGDVLVAEIGPVVVGYLSLRPFYKLESSSHVLEINGMAVDPNHRREGAGRGLIEAAIALAERRGCRKLMLRVLSSNAPALALYGACGFTTEGILRDQFLLGGRYVDDVFMAVSLVADPARS
jgi:ribosomal protein S18 acetylase RimI-like enzyme